MEINAREKIIPPKPIRKLLASWKIMEALLVIVLVVVLSWFAILSFTNDRFLSFFNEDMRGIVLALFLVLTLFSYQKLRMFIFLIWLRKHFNKQKDSLLWNYVIWKNFLSERKFKKEKNTKIISSIKKYAKQYEQGDRDSLIDTSFRFSEETSFLNANIVSTVIMLIIIISYAVFLLFELGSILSLSIKLPISVILILIGFFHAKKINSKKIRLKINSQGIEVSNKNYSWDDIAHECIVVRENSQEEKKFQRFSNYYLMFSHEGISHEFLLNHLNQKKLADALFYYRIVSGIQPALIEELHGKRVKKKIPFTNLYEE